MNGNTIPFKREVPIGSVTLRAQDEIEAAVASTGGTERFPAAQNGNGSEIPDGVPVLLRTVVKNLPSNLQVAIQTPPDAQMRAHIPLQTIASQLPRGAVNVTFAELRRGSPHGVFSSSPIFDKKRVKLPLEDILIYVKPSRRPNQKQTELPDDIPPLFARNGKALLPDNQDGNTNGASSGPETLAAPIPPTSEPESVESASPNQAAAEDEPLPIKFPYATEQATRDPEESPKPVFATLPDNDAARGEQQHIELALEAVSDVLPEPIQAEIAEAGIETVIEIPLAELAPMMARGRIVFAWKAMHRWIRPGLPPTNHGDLEVQLPLKEIIPLFMAAHRPTRRDGIRTAIHSDIPEIFKGRGESPFKVVKSEEDTEEVASESIVSESESSDDVPSLDPQHTAGRRDPKRFLEEAVALEGIDGVIFASHDGLVVSEHMPPHVDSSALAAFLPEMIGRTTDYLSKSHIGCPDWMILQVDGRMLQISKVGDLCLAVLGEVGKPLPRAKLREIMNRLAEEQPAN